MTKDAFTDMALIVEEMCSTDLEVRKRARDTLNSLDPDVVDEILAMRADAAAQRIRAKAWNWMAQMRPFIPWNALMVAGLLSLSLGVITHASWRAQFILSIC